MAASESIAESIEASDKPSGFLCYNMMNRLIYQETAGDRVNGWEKGPKKTI